MKQSNTRKTTIQTQSLLHFNPFHTNKHNSSKPDNRRVKNVVSVTVKPVKNGLDTPYTTNDNTPHTPPHTTQTNITTTESSIANNINAISSGNTVDTHSNSHISGNSSSSTNNSSSGSGSISSFFGSGIGRSAKIFAL